MILLLEVLSMWSNMDHGCVHNHYKKDSEVLYMLPHTARGSLDLNVARPIYALAAYRHRDIDKQLARKLVWLRETDIS